MASKRAAQRVPGGLTRFTEGRLRLRVNREKSSISHAATAVLLGFGFYFTTGGPGIRIDPKALRRMRHRIRELTRRSRSITMPTRIRALNRYITGWCAYFALADVSRPLRDVEWLRRRLRQVRWKEWKRFKGRRRGLRPLGIPDQKAREWAASSKGYWRLARSAPLQRAMPKTYWDDLGLRDFSRTYRRLRRN